MLVCHCHAVDDHTIRRCVNDGARSRNDVREACGAGSSCGGCRPAIDRLLSLQNNEQGAADTSGSQG
jgi:bacterioferritin-associated ferredoxin